MSASPTLPVLQKQTTDASDLYPYYIIDGKAYDLREWADKHPGGRTWFVPSKGRDISVAFHAYHSDPEKLQRILKKYEIDIPLNQALNPSMGVPSFIVPEDFDARRYRQSYNWHSQDFLSTVKQKINTPSMKKKIRRADVAFDGIAALICILHLCMMFWGVSNQVLPIWGFILLFTVTRTAMAAVGHYHCHRKKNGKTDWGDSLFDMQYVGASMILYDGHVLLHHLYTNSPADVKRTVFTGMLQLPRLWRIPIYTIQKFAQFLTGMLIRYIHVGLVDKYWGQWSLRKHLQFVFVRLLLIAEFFFCIYTGNLWLWIGQFLLCLWWNLFLIVSSHDFEASESQADLSSGQDWGVFQIKNSFDMSVVGNPYIDCFLTAGLGSHRVHHVLPAQKSGFANILCEPIVKETSQEFGVPWVKTKNFVTDRLPKLFSFYILAPLGEKKGMNVKKQNILLEAFSWKGIRSVLSFTILGFTGIGSI